MNEENMSETGQIPESQIPVTVNVIDRAEEILSPDMSMIEKVGTMARLCYKNEAKEGEDTNTVNERIIRKCIAEGHESVLEHAVMSLYLPVQECHDSLHILEKLMGRKNASTRVPFRGIWEANGTESQVRGLVPFQDPHLYAKLMQKTRVLATPEAQGQILPCLVGNVRMWRNVLNEKLVVITQLADDPLQLAIYMRVLQAFYQAAPIFFEDIYNRINESILKVASVEEETPDVPKTRCYTKVIAPVDKEKRNIDGIVEHFFDTPTDIYADEASSVASISCIFTTDRATTHQLVRHRKDVAYSQESQRYVNYDKKGYNVIHLTVEPSKQWDERKLIENYDLGSVKTDSKFYKAWVRAMQQAFQNYHDFQLMEDRGETEDANAKALTLPIETVRGVLPNDTATKIGVTWMLPGGLSNLLHFRVEKHAQYAIRSMIDRFLIKALEMGHPYFYNVDPIEFKNHLNEIKNQNIFKDPARVDKLIQMQEDRVKAIIEYNKERAKIEAELRKKAEDEARIAAEKARVLAEGEGKTEPSAETASDAAPADTNEAPAEETETPDPERKIIILGKENPDEAIPPTTVPRNAPSVSFEKPAEPAETPKAE